MKLTNCFLILVMCGFGHAFLFDTFDIALQTLIELGRSFSFRTFNFFTGGCVECIMLADFIILLRHIGTTREMFMVLFRGFCGTTEVVPSVDYDVCIGLVEMNLDTLLYIIDNDFTMDGMQFCTVALQYGNCLPKPADWNVNVPPGQSVPSNQTSIQEPITIAHITDVHYDSLYAPYSNKNCDRPLCCQRLNNLTVANNAKAGYWTDYNNCDIPGYFMENAFQDIVSRIQPNYVYFTGDIFAHDSWVRTKQRNIDDTNYFTNMLTSKFPNAQIFPILGNHDTHPLNLYSPHKVDSTPLSTSWVFESAYEAWKAFLPESTKDTILKGGYYTTTTTEGLRIIALNNNVGYCLNFWLLNEPVDPYDQLKWFAETLLAAEQANEKVHVLMHLPNGDSFMNIPYAKNFRNIVTRFRYTITGIFCGHTHLDELEIIYDGTNPTNVIWNGGSLTPFSNFNPNYRIYEVEVPTFNILDFVDYIVDLDVANLDTGSLEWRSLYSFRQRYDVPNMSAESIADLAYRMAQSKDLRQTYFRNSVRYAPPSIQTGCDESCERDYLCKMVTSVYRDDIICTNLTNSMT